MTAAREGTWIVITASVTGSTESGTSTEYASDLKPFSRKSEAVTHGFGLGRADDFNLGFVRSGRLESLWWMDRQIAEHPETLARIGREMGLTK